jgi:hypothetical protein
MKVYNKILTAKELAWVDIVIIIGLAVFPLFSSFPYRVNIFLSWEGAYRMFLGHVPYKDFGLPMGYAYWVIPAIFFKIFGPYFASLIKAQVFINIISGLSFRSILNTLKVSAGVRVVSVLLFCISYSLFNFWPWYNHSVIVFEIIALSFLLKFIFQETRYRYLNLLAASFFFFWSIFTKQDAGALAFLVGLALVLYHSIADKSYKDFGIFILMFVGFAALCILPFANQGFFYWFNYGQEPHYSRVELFDIVSDFFAGSFWEKFYIALILIIAFMRWNSVKELFSNKREMVFLLMTLGIMAEALIFKVTSYTPPDNNIFFHSFAVAFLLSHAGSRLHVERVPVFVAMTLLLLIWWSGVYYKYIERMIVRMVPASNVKDPNKISRSTYIVNQDTTNINMSQWKFSKLKAFEKVYMPEPTIEGIERLMEMPQIKNKKSPKVLNMTELTPLAHAIGYELEKGQPLWYHKNVGIFQPQIDVFCKKIQRKEYDVVLFETIPYLNNFFPEEVRENLQKHYVLKDRFLAPRRPTDSHIEVYTLE